MSKKYKKAFGLGLTSFIRRCYKGMWLVLSIPLVVVLRGISPLLTIRFAKVQTDRLGHMFTIEVYLSEQDLGLRPKRTFDIFYFYPIPSIISNQQVFKMWQQNVYFIPLVHMAYFADRINRLLPGYEKHIVRINTLLNDEKYLKYSSGSVPTNFVCFVPHVSSTLLSTKAHLQFSKQEEQYGQEQLQKMGIPKNMPFICFHARDSAYLDQLQPDRDWSYHDYRDATIQNYILAAEEVAQRGVFALRMGTVSEKNIETSSEKVIDYSKNFHSDFMDLYLAKECHFFIASNSGIYSLPLFFRKPTIIPNIIDFSDIPAWSGKDLFILKKFYSESENRFLSFREIYEFVSKEQSDHTSHFIEQKVKLIENTREAIREIVIDMDDRLNKTWQETEVDVQLQERFLRLMESCGIHLPPQLKIGAIFLEITSTY